MGTTLITKDTRAFIHGNVDAKGNTATGLTVIAGTVGGSGFATEVIKGVAVQAISQERTFASSTSGLPVPGGIPVAVASAAGSLNVQIVDSNTSAYIANNAKVNVDQTNAAASQTVNVSAVNDVKVFGIGIGLQGPGGLTAAVGVDLGLIKNDTIAFLGDGVEVVARRDVEVNARSTKKSTVSRPDLARA